MDIHALLKPLQDLKWARPDPDSSGDRELKELIANWGSLRIGSRLANYAESRRFIAEHLDMWHLAVRRVLGRLELLAHAEDVCAPDVLIKNQIKLTREAIRYLVYATRGLSSNIFFRDYRPRRKHEAKYLCWVEKKIKFNCLTAKESGIFWRGFLLRGRIRLAVTKDKVYLIFYHHDDDPLGLKKSIVASKQRRTAIA